MSVTLSPKHKPAFLTLNNKYISFLGSTAQLRPWP